MAEIKYCGKYQGPVNKGEERLLEFLKANLPDSYYLLPGIELPNLNPKNGQVQYLEFDCLVITPHAIYNIENKDYAGRLDGDDNFWYHKDREMRNPHKTVGFKSCVLASKLKTVNSSYGKAWVQSLVTLSHPFEKFRGIWNDEQVQYSDEQLFKIREWLYAMCNVALSVAEEHFVYRNKIVELKPETDEAKESHFIHPSEYRRAS